MPLDPTLEALLAQLAGDAPKLHELAPEQARKAFEALELPAPEVTLGDVEDATLAGPAGQIPVRIYRPGLPAPHPVPVLVYFHGGGWVVGSIDTHDGTCRELCHHAGCAVVSVGYRLAPEHPYPAATDDCLAALRQIAAEHAAFGLDASRLAVGGDSAGGNLAAVTALRARDEGGPDLAFQLLVYPVTDADFERASYRENAEGYFLEKAAMEWFWGHYVPDPARRREPGAAPLRAENLAGLPRALVITAEFDPLRDEGEAYALRLEQAGVPTTLRRYDGMIHGFFGMGALVEPARRAVLESATALRGAFGL